MTRLDGPKLRTILIQDRETIDERIAIQLASCTTEELIALKLIDPPPPPTPKPTAIVAPGPRQATLFQ